MDELDNDLGLVSTDDLVASLEQEVTAPSAAPVVEQVPNIPEKFRGKSVEDIVKSYQELESQLGKQGSELGDLRKLADNFILSQQPRKPPADEDVFHEPESDVRKLVERELEPYKNDILEARQSKMDTKLKEVHTDYLDIVKENDFQNWVKESPIRIELFARADRNYDYVSGIELFSMYKAMKGMNTPREVNDDSRARDEALAAGSMEHRTVTETASRKVYRRADLIQLQLNNPAKYASLQDEIYRAYEEGRVR